MERFTFDFHFTDAQKYLYLLGRSATRGSEYINASFVNVREATCGSCVHVIRTCFTCAHDASVCKQLMLILCFVLKSPL